MTGDEKLKMA